MSHFATTLHPMKTSILTKESNDFKLKIMESLLTARVKPCVNKTDSSFAFRAFLI